VSEQPSDPSRPAGRRRGDVSASTTRHVPDLGPAQDPGGSQPVSQQYDLFTRFFGDPEHLSHTIELWDAIPKYAVGARMQAAMRDEHGNLPVYEQEFLYRPTVPGLPKEVLCKMTIQPAHVQDPDGTYRQYFPSVNEELIEEILKKLYADQKYGSFSGNESWVRFSLTMIYNELQRRGKSRSYAEIKRSLEILSRAVYTVQFTKANAKLVYTNPILTELTSVTRADYLQDPHSMWVAKLSALISKSVNELTYRQFNYGTLMRLASPLARWLHRRLAHQYTQASLIDPYHITFRSIKRDSGLLHQSRESANVKTVDAALDELVKVDVLMHYKKDVRRQGTKILDVLYTMLPTLTFRDEVRTANARQTKQRIQSTTPG
jgi:hypothetical protein